ncbi:hypothetical protein OUZ56_013298 [Daphnia magna]|uniref:Uncharacterized protein n=1 Tax=Daphnia magna TaxID=35525 RepID=A0ABQ9Z5J3_9CRUS|nr:hypothetical protein OUZ56_013298 [Daphnia magna]
MPLLLEFLMNSSPQGMPPQQQDQRNHHQTQLLIFIYFVLNHHFHMPSQSFAAFTALLRLTTCILLCKPFIILFMPSPHYGTNCQVLFAFTLKKRRPVVIMPPYGIKNIMPTAE